MRMDTVVPAESGLGECINSERVEDKVDVLLKFASIGYLYYQQEQSVAEPAGYRQPSPASTRSSVMPSARKKPNKPVPVSSFWEPKKLQGAKSLINKYTRLYWRLKIFFSLLIILDASE